MKIVGGGVLVAAALLSVTPPANAALVETVTVSNSFGYIFAGGGSVDLKTGGTRETAFEAQRFPTLESDLGVDYVGEAGSSSFFFLHNNYCVGNCSTGSRTVITFTVTNTGDSPLDLRFDSLITPGHLARVDGTSSVRGGFDFSVTQRSAGVADNALYTANGRVTDDSLVVSTSTGTPFNGKVAYELPGGRVLDWSTTPLNLELGTLAAGATTQVEYAASYFLTSFEKCPDVLTCGGLQVVFGDPRNNGSVRTLARGFGALTLGDAVTMINRDYDPFNVPYAFNLSGSPYPGLPPAEGPVRYTGTYKPLDSAVPEPATWISLIVGMASIGVALRGERRRRGGGHNNVTVGA